MKQAEPNDRSLVIYWDSERKCRQIVRPSKEFKGDWSALANGITNGLHYSYDIC
jgi:hypothetical protein